MYNQPLTNQILEEVRAIAHEAGLRIRGVKNPYMPDSRILSFLMVSRVRWQYSPRRPHPAALLFFVLALLAYLLTACNLEDLSGLRYFVITRTPTVTPTATATATPEPCTVQTGTPSGYLNLRTGAGTQYPIVRVLDEGEVLTVIARGDWLEVMDTRGNKGYVYSRYCK